MLSRERGNLILAKAKRKFGVANFADVAGSYGKIDWSQFMLTPNIRQMARIESRSFMAF